MTDVTQHFDCRACRTGQSRTSRYGGENRNNSHHTGSNYPNTSRKAPSLPCAHVYTATSRKPPRGQRTTSHSASAHKTAAEPHPTRHIQPLRRHEDHTPRNYHQTPRTHRQHATNTAHTKTTTRRGPQRHHRPEKNERRERIYICGSHGHPRVKLGQQGARRQPIRY